MDFQMRQECPMLRRELVVSRQTSADGGTAFVIKDPQGRFYRLPELEYFIARQLDGTASLDLVRRRVQESFGCLLSRENLEQFVDRLRAMRLLREAEGEVPEHPHQRR